jgi:3-methyladenine DNA glycosylase AlkD
MVGTGGAAPLSPAREASSGYSGAAMKKRLVHLVQARLHALADPEKATAMAAYAKSEMPFYGVQKPYRVPLHREMKRLFKPADRDEYEECVLALWRLPHREEKYTALEFAAQHRAFVVPESLPLFERLIREGGWWDFVDFVAPQLVGPTLLEHRDRLRPVMEAWIEDDDLWIRRSAIIVQLKHRDRTDQHQLFDFCLRRAHEKEFFIRKAIGWALREYGKTAPESVATFLRDHRSRLSGLSYREGSRRLVKAGLM